jgi:hypothetical protein
MKLMRICDAELNKKNESVQKSMCHHVADSAQAFTLFENKTRNV